MTVRAILQSAHTGGSEADERVLRKPAALVDEFDESLVGLVRDLSDTLWSQPICVGLAAPQIGVPLAVAVVNWARETPEQDLVLVNPVVTSTSGKKDRKREACMSVWGVAGEVERRERLALTFKDGHGSDCSLDVEGFPARVIMHELDHLQGHLYLDRMREGTQVAPSPLFEPQDLPSLTDIG